MILFLAKETRQVKIFFFFFFRGEVEGGGNRGGGFWGVAPGVGNGCLGTQRETLGLTHVTVINCEIPNHPCVSVLPLLSFSLREKLLLSRGNPSEEELVYSPDLCYVSGSPTYVHFSMIDGEQSLGWR